MSSTIISSHDHWLTTHLMISFLLCCDQLVAFGKAISYSQEKLSFLPSFLACNPFCFCSAATGSTSPLSQDGLCRFYFFSLIPQTHFLTGITKINDDFWFLNKKQNKTNSTFRIESHRIFSFSAIVFTCVSNHCWLSASQPAKIYFLQTFMCPKWFWHLEGKNSPLNMFYKLCEGKFTFPHNFHIFLLFLCLFFFISWCNPPSKTYSLLLDFLWKAKAAMQVPKKEDLLHDCCWDIFEHTFCFHLLAFCFSWKDRNTIMDRNEEKKLFFDFQTSEWMFLLFLLEKKRKGKE